MYFRKKFQKDFHQNNFLQNAFFNINSNKQLFLNEIAFRFRKDIGSSKRPGVVIILHEKYWGVGDLWLHVTVITVNKYFPFTLPPLLSPCALGFACCGYSCPRLPYYTTGVGVQWMTSFLKTVFCLRSI